MPDRLIVCLDGTWNSPFRPVTRDDGTDVLKPTNPLKISRAVRPLDDDGNRQVTYYHSGVGALGLYPGISNRILNFADSKLGGIWGAGFEASVEQAATFITHNLTPGAEIFVFGFSRGAAQSRALARFLDWMGGVPDKSDAYYVPVFFREYLETRGKGSPRDVTNSKGEFIAERIKPAPIRFLGVWDTVMALGARSRATAGTSVKDRAFHIGTRPPSNVRNARQAIAIDEMRYDFRPEVWEESGADQTMEQLWFPGAHGNVGGSYVKDGLANSALHWIADAAEGLGLALDREFLGKYRPYPQHMIGDTHDNFWRAVETLRGKNGEGARRLTGYPETANLGLHKSVIQRFCADPAEHKDMDAPYRPAALVALLKPHRENWAEYVSGFGLAPETYPFPKDV